MKYTVPFTNIATLAVADSYKTILAIVMGDTDNGHRARLRKLVVTPSDAIPVDVPLMIAVKRIADVSVGTAGTAGSTVLASAVAKVDPNSVDSFASAKLNYSAEPTTYEAQELFRAAVNTRAGLIEHWDEDDYAPMIGRDQHLGLLLAPRNTTAIVVSGLMTFETF